ncbi:MAG: hypothetical protein Q8Q97_01175 [bacterium]|nr:hypothetical protein [bacterium]
MKIKFTHLLIVALLISLIHFWALQAGLYERGAQIDIPLHFLAGIFLGLSGLWIFQKKQNLFGNPSGALLSAALIGFVLFWSVIWEIFEFSFRTFAPQWSALQFYSPTVPDLLSDLFFGLLGGIIIASIFILRQKI